MDVRISRPAYPLAAAAKSLGLLALKATRRIDEYEMAGAGEPGELTQYRLSPWAILRLQAEEFLDVTDIDGGPSRCPHSLSRNNATSRSVANATSMVRSLRGRPAAYDPALGRSSIIPDGVFARVLGEPTGDPEATLAPILRASGASVADSQGSSWPTFTSLPGEQQVKPGSLAAGHRFRSG